jgi:hypothetical protein
MTKRTSKSKNWYSVIFLSFLFHTAFYAEPVPI